MEIQLEEERSQRSQSSSSKKQLEAELQETESQLETTSRGKEEAMKQLKRLQVGPIIFVDINMYLCSSQWPAFSKKTTFLSQGQMKEVLRELDETKLSREEVLAQSKDSDKKIQTLEAEVLQLSEVCVLIQNPVERLSCF